MKSAYTFMRDKIAIPLEKFTQRINIIHILLISILMAALSINYHHGGVLQNELEVRIPFYLADRPLLNKLYDSRIIEEDLYVSRELSYVFDFLDAQFIALSVSLGYPHFISFSFYVFTIAIGMLLWQFCVVELKLKRWIGLGMLLLFWTSPNAFLGGAYFRSAKPGVALCVVVLYYLVYHAIQAQRRNRLYRFPTGLLATCFGFAMAATLFDHEGVFMVAALLTFVLLWGCVFPSRTILKLGVTFVAVLVLFLLYDYILGPWLTFSLNHYWPDFSFQQIPWGAIFTPSKVALPLMWSGLLYVDTLRFLAGNISRPAAFLLILAIISLAFFVISRMRSQGKDVRAMLAATTGLILCDLVLVCGMIMLMVFAHPPVTWPEVERTYYFMPLACSMFMTLALVISQFSTRGLLPGWLLVILFIAAITGNIFAIPADLAIFIKNEYMPFYETAPRLLAALKNLGNNHYQVPLDIQNDAVYHFFRSRLVR